MIWHFGVTDGAEIDGIVKPQPVEPILRHHPAEIDIALAAPVELVPLKAEAVGASRRLHCGDAFRHHLAPDAVPGDHRNPIIFRHAKSCNRQPARDRKIVGWVGQHAKPTDFSGSAKIDWFPLRSTHPTNS
jgi:hypothetical protein